MAEMELYHVHKVGKCDKKWQPNKVITIDNFYNSEMNKRNNAFSTSINLVDEDSISSEEVPFHDFLSDIIMNFHYNPDKLTEYDLQLLKQLLMQAHDMSFFASFFKREQALENCRKDNFSNLPSRLHSLYLCDRDNLDYWEEVIRRDNLETTEVYKVYVNGNIFKTYESCLPLQTMDYKSSYDQAIKYWRATGNDTSVNDAEYLVQGTVKIIEKIR